MAFTPSLMMLVHYFDKKRGTAIAIGTAGASFGAIAISPFLAFSFEHYGYTGTMLMLGGISFNLCVGGALLRPFVEVPHDLDARVASFTHSTRSAEENEEIQVASLLSIYDVTGVTHMPDERHSSIHTYPLNGLSVMRVSSCVLNHADIHVTHSHTNRHVQFSSAAENHPNRNENHNDPDTRAASEVAGNQEELQAHDVSSMHVPSHVQQVCIINEPPFQSEQERTTQLHNSKHDRKSRISMMSQRAETAWCTFKRAMALTKQPIVALFCVSIITVPVSLLCVLNFLPDTALSGGVDRKSASYLVSMFGITNLVGLPFWGIIYDTSVVIHRRRLVYYVCGRSSIFVNNSFTV